MKTISLGSLQVDAADYGSQGNAIFGIRGSGKTYTATLIAEQLFDVGIPFVAFDPTGIWRFLRVAGKKEGRPIVVAGGAEGDLKLTPATAPTIVESAMQNGVSLVVDLYAMDLGKNDWRRIVGDCVRMMLYRNKAFGLRHVFIEEAAEFAPQIIPKDGVSAIVYAEMEKLARWGGNSSLGYTLINQRAEQVNKAVSELCENNFLHRQKGKNSVTALKKWFDIVGAEKADEIIQSMATLPTGECWAWVGDQPAKRIKVQSKDSFHPDRRMLRGEVDLKAQATVSVSSFVEKMRTTLVTVEAEQKANDPKELRSRIAQLERDLRQKPPAAAVVAEPVRIPFLTDEQMRELHVINARLGKLEELIPNQDAALRECAIELRTLRSEIDVKLRSFDKQLASGPRPQLPAASREALRHRNPEPVRSSAGIDSNGMLTKGARTILLAIAQHEGEGCTREQLSVLTGYKRSSRDTYLQQLSSGGLIEPDGDRLIITGRGVRELGSDFEPLPTGAWLRDYWMNRLSGGERVILEKAVQCFPQGLDRDDVTEYKRSSRDTFIQKLMARKLVTAPLRGFIRASDNLF